MAANLMKRALRALALGVSLALIAQGTAQNSANAASSGGRSTPSDAEIRRILVDHVDTQRQSVGIVVGVIDAAGRRVASYGQLNQGDARPLSGDTLFEIGSITKVFTSLLLSEMVRSGEVALNDPVGKYLPPRANIPARSGKQITLVDLATHTSGLPTLPDNLAPKDEANPYADYTNEQLYQFLSHYTLTRDIGSRYEYSNLGAGLLGHALAQRAGLDFEALIRQRITGPLGMRGTVIALSPEMSARLAVGHNYALTPVKNWDLGPGLTGGGALRSTANDLLTFLAAELGFGGTPLKSAMDAQLSVRRPTGIPNLDVALGWLVQSDTLGTALWHEGATGGYRSFIGFDPARRVGVVVLANAQTAGVGDIGYHLLMGKPLAAPRVPAVARKEIELGTDIKQRYVGQYELAPNAILSITIDGARLFAQVTAQPKFQIYPESQTSFFWMVVDAQLTFELGPDNRVISAILHQNGRNTVGRRIDPTSP